MATFGASWPRPPLGQQMWGKTLCFLPQTALSVSKKTNNTPSPPKHPLYICSHVFLSLSYPERAHCFSFQGLKKKGANSHCLLIYFCFFFSPLCTTWGCSSCRYCTAPAPAGLYLCTSSHQRKGFAGVAFFSSWAWSSRAARIDAG